MAASPPSDSLKVEAGRPEQRMWRAQAITLPGDPGRLAPAPSPLLRHEFNLGDAPIRAFLHVSSLGIHEVRINGQRVGDHLLSPGWTSYHRRLLADTHDVTALLRPGRNVVAAVLGDGWYRGRLGFETGEDRCRYGTEVALILQLEAEMPDGSTVVITSSPQWRVATGEIQAADLYDGAVVDLRQARSGWDRPGYDDSLWIPAAVVPLNLEIIEPRTSPPVREIETRSVELARVTNERIRIDSGQNLAGFVRLHVRGAPGIRVIVRHAEVLEPDGALHTRALRTARATDEYILADSEVTLLQPPFTFHGFRYAEIDTTADVLDAEVVAISSDLRPRGAFACSDQRLVQLHQNVVWSQRSNFVSIPTDCPQRDERLGWTGDAQAFAPTANTLFHSESFWTSWLRDLDLDQDDELGVPSVVPDVVLGGEARYGRAGWGDAATIVPWAVFESYGDAAILERQLPSMRRWVDSLVRRQEADGLLQRSWQFGDWLDPDAPSDQPWKAKADPEFIANAFFAWSSRLTGDAEAIAGDRASAHRYRELASRVARATWDRWSAEAVRTQTGCAIALRFGIAPQVEREGVADALARMVDEADGRVATGFLGTPLVLPALAEAGRFDQAYRMLLRTDSPSWLYQVAHGATTVWERWDAIRPDGSIHPGTMAPIPQDDGAEGREGHMLSFNHYAYGAVIDWVYRHVAGLAPVRDRPGYAHVVFAPKPVTGMGWAKGSVESSFGPVSIEWRIDDGTFTANVVLPTGTTGTFIPPATATSTVMADDEVSATDQIELAAGVHGLAVTHPAIAMSG